MFLIEIKKTFLTLHKFNYMKIKIGWGMGIVIAFIVFIGFIMYFVFNMIMNKKYDHDFVTENYYEKELAYQQSKNSIEATHASGMAVEIVPSKEGVTLVFPEKVAENQIVGTVSFYRPSDQNRDFKIPLQLKENKMLIPISVLELGRWNVEVNYVFDQKEYLSAKNILIE